MVTKEFDLIDGFEDKSGAVHTHVVMRRLNGNDEIAIFNDAEILGLRKFKFDMGSTDPIEIFHLKSAMLVYNSLLVSKVILSIGDIKDIDRYKVRQLSQADVELILTNYAELNGIDQEAAKKVPFGAGLTLPQTSPTQ